MNGLFCSLGDLCEGCVKHCTEKWHLTRKVEFDGL